MATHLSNLNLSGNQLQNFVVHPLATAPTGKLGLKFFDTANKREKIYDGSAWLETAYMSDIASVNGIASGIDTRLKAIEAYFATTDDADTNINKWNEIVAFLNATEGTTLAGILAGYAVKTRKITAGTGLTGGGNLEADRTISLETVSGLSAGTYKSVTVDTYGRVTAGTNPTTLSGFGITNAYTKDEVDAKLQELAEAATNVSYKANTTKTAVLGTITIDGTDNAVTLTKNNIRAVIGEGTGGQVLSSSDGDYAWKTLSKSDVGLSNVENTKLSTWAGSKAITTLGTITTGTWNGTKIANAYLANSSVTIAGKSVSLGGSLSASDIISALSLTTVTKKYAGAITKGTATSYTVKHSLNTRDVVVMVYDPSTYEQVIVDTTMTDANNITLTFGSAPTANYKVVVIG